MNATLTAPTTTTTPDPRFAALPYTQLVGHVRAHGLTPTAAGKGRVVRTRPEWKEVAYKLANSRDAAGTRVIGFDTETLDRQFPDVGLVGFSVAWYEEAQGTRVIQRAYVPVGHATGEMQLHPTDVLPALKQLLEDDDLLVVMQNAKYDIKVSALNGIAVTENVFDTLIFSWLLNTNGVGSPLQVLMGEGEHGLKALSKHLLGYVMEELTDLAPKEKWVRGGVEFETLRVDLVPIEDQYENGVVVKRGIANYAGDDSVQVLKLREFFLDKLLAEDEADAPNAGKTWKVYDSIQREFIFVLADMEGFGVELDAEHLNRMRVKVEAELLLIKERMYSLRPGQDFDYFTDPALLKKFAQAWDDLDRKFELPKDHVDFPKTAKERSLGRGKGKETYLVPASKATARKALITAYGMTGLPVMDRVRDDKMRVEVIRFPHLAHKLFNPNSGIELNRVLFDELGLAPIGDKGANGLYSTKSEYIETWKNQGDVFSGELDRLREIDKLLGTYLIGMVARRSKDGRIRGRMTQGGTRTGRLSMSDPNLQNQPNSPEFPIREAFVASGILASQVTIHEWHLDDKGKPTKPKHLTVQALPPDHPDALAYLAMTGRVLDGGYELLDGWVVKWWGSRPPWVLFVGDYSQLEICLLAHESNDEKLVTAVREEQDIHALTAQAVFDDVPKDISLDEVKKSYGKQRKNAKPVNFGIIYGMGPGKLAATLGITEQEAKDIIEERYMGFYTGVAAWIQRKHREVQALGYVKTAVGRKRHLPAARLDPKGQSFGMENRALISKAKRQAQNTPIQGLAADLVALAMRDIRRHFKTVSLADLLASGDAMLALDGQPPVQQGTTLWGELMRMLLQVHDEVLNESHPAIANYIRRETVEMMQTAGGMTFRVPIRVDAKLGTNWLLTKE